jgi:hypothetical protein
MYLASVWIPSKKYQKLDLGQYQSILCLRQAVSFESRKQIGDGVGAVVNGINKVNTLDSEQWSSRKMGSSETLDTGTAPTWTPSTPREV